MLDDKQLNKIYINNMLDDKQLNKIYINNVEIATMEDFMKVAETNIKLESKLEQVKEKLKADIEKGLGFYIDYETDNPIAKRKSYAQELLKILE